MPRTTARFSLTRVSIGVLYASIVLAQTPKPTIEDVAWIEGHWQGSALVGLADEYWSSPMAGTIMGMFRLVKDDRIVFYELFRIAEERNTLVLRLKHFHPDMKGWEEKDSMVTFPLLSMSKDQARFDGMTFTRTGPDAMDVVVLIGQKGQAPRAVKFAYRRAK